MKLIFTIILSFKNGTKKKKKMKQKQNGINANDKLLGTRLDWTGLMKK